MPSYQLPINVSILSNIVLSFAKVLECNQIAQAINLLAGLIPGEDSPKQADGTFLGKLVVFSLMWSLGALLELDDRKKVQYCTVSSVEFKFIKLTW